MTLYTYSHEKEILEPQLPEMPKDPFVFNLDAWEEQCKRIKQIFPSYHAPRALWGEVDRVVEDGEFIISDPNPYSWLTPVTAIPIEKESKHTFDNEKHFATCNFCQQQFDMRDLRQVCEHFHDDVPKPEHPYHGQLVDKERGVGEITETEIEAQAEKQTSFPTMCYPSRNMKVQCKLKYIDGAKWMQERLAKPQPVNLSEILEEILKGETVGRVDRPLCFQTSRVVEVSHIKEVFSRYGVKPLK